MTNIEYYGHKNLEYFQIDGNEYSVVDIYYKTKHAPKDQYVRVGNIWCPKEDVVKEKTKWLLEEPRHYHSRLVNWAIITKDGMPYVYKMKHCKECYHGRS